MKRYFLYSLILTVCLNVTFQTANSQTVKKSTSEWVYPGKDGKLVYKTTASGDKIMDFSHAGYMGGGVALPDVPVKVTVKPTGADDETAAIQAAVNQVATMPFVNGFRGAVLLAPGEFKCANTINIIANGIVLRGSGSGAGGTTIKMVGPRHTAVVIGKMRDRRSRENQEDIEDTVDVKDFVSAETSIADAYVPFGANTFTVASTAGFKVGDRIAIQRPTTAAWVHFMQMDSMKRNGRPQTWISGSRVGIAERKITKISGNKITVDVPLPDSYDSKYLNPPGTTIGKVKPVTRVTQVGVENLHIQCEPNEIAYGQAPYSAVRVGGDDCWLRDLYCEETMNTTAYTGERITVEKVVVKHTYPNLGASKPADFSIEGGQILIDRCSATGGNTYFVWTSSYKFGPNVVLNSAFSGFGSHIQPHQRWSTGLLVDNCIIPDGRIDFINRGVAGSGHGWTMGWAVAWNCIAQAYVIQNPPGVQNWAIGCIGNREKMPRLFDTAPLQPEGVFDSHGNPVAPQSLYLAQLNERLGSQALKNIGYASNSENLFVKDVKPTPAQAPEINKELGINLAIFRPVAANNKRTETREFAPEKALDANDKTYWATKDSIGRAFIEIDTEGPLEINAIELCEAPGFEGQVLEYKLEGQVDSDYKLLAQGTTLGASKVDRFPKVTVWKVRLSISKVKNYPAISRFGLYLAK